MSMNDENLNEEKRRAFTLFRNNQLQEAKALYLRICEGDPDDAEAWHVLGVINGRLGIIDEAEAACRHAIAANPHYAVAHCDLGNALFIKGHLDEAVACYQEALRLNNNFAEAYNNLGNVLNALSRLDEAAESYRSALNLYPNAMTYCSLGNVLVRQQKLDEAATMYRECLKRDPNNSVAQHKLVACTGEGTPERASDNYIRQTFDQFAANFDKTLSEIGYRGPAAVMETVEGMFGAPAGNLEILDAGCGTGLCGPGLKPYARRLIGVDLSSGMLAKAAERQHYDQLIAAELTAYLLGAPQSYDLIVSADTLVYFGALDALFAAAAQSLRENGVLVFTVERADTEAGAPDYRLNPHGRYSHSEDYLRRSLGDAGFSIEVLSDFVVRMEAGKQVPGMVVAARLAAA
ncbi:MAG: tetratricopeptide repeat protein [Gammaproteobacteria bacterium]